MNETQANTIAIKELIVMQKQTSKDMDKLITHLDKIPIVRVVSLEKRMESLEKDCNRRSWWAFTTIVTVLGVFIYKHFFGS